MKKLLVSSLLIGTSLLADVRAPEVLTKNSFETSEFQVFVTNTRNVPITKDLVAKIVFEGEIEDYYKEYNKMVEQIKLQNLNLLINIRNRLKKKNKQ